MSVSPLRASSVVLMTGLLFALEAGALAAQSGDLTPELCSFCDLEVSPGTEGRLEPDKCQLQCSAATWTSYRCLASCYGLLSFDDEATCWELYCEPELDRCVAENPHIASHPIACARKRMEDDPTFQRKPFWLRSSLLGTQTEEGTVEDGEGYGVGVGFRSQDGLGVELSWSHVQSDTRPGLDLERHAYDLSLILPLTSRRRTGLDLAFGPGWTEAKGPAVPALGLADSSFTAHLGLIFDFDLTRKWFLRADARGRWIEADDQFDYEVGVGMGLRF